MSILELINYYSVSCKTTIIKIYTTYSRANGRERQSDTTSLTNEMFVSFSADKKKMPTHTWHRPTLFLYLLTMPVGRDQQQHQQSPHHTLKLYTKKKTDSLRANAKHRIKKSSEVTQGNKCHCAVLFGSDHMRSVVIPLCFLLNFMFLAWKKKQKKYRIRKKSAMCRVEHSRKTKIWTNRAWIFVKRVMI